jgi:hypothetical protein
MTDPILAALDEQVACYRKLAKLAEAQHEYVQQSQTEKLLEVLRRRQEVLDRITAFEKTVGPAKREWPEYRSRLAPSLRDKAEALLAETRRLLEQITTADRNDAIVLQQRKLNLGRQINKASVARKMNRNYAASAYGSKRPQMDIQQ